MALGAILGGASLIGKLFGGAAAGSSKERGNVNTFNQNQDQLRNQQYNTRQSTLAQLLGLDERATMDRAKLGLDAPGQRTRQQILGSLLQTLQPMRISNLPAGVQMGTVTGGLSPANLNPAARAGGAELQKQALQALLSKSDVPAPTNYAQQGMLAPPDLTPYQKSGKLESIMSLIGLIGGGAELAKGALDERARRPAYDYGNMGEGSWGQG